jgi:two-component system, LuxR family, response regulator FixJ
MLNRDSGEVAVVDDDPAVLDSLKFLLELEGYRVNTYSSAGAFLADRVAAPNCLILDQHMPQMSGLDLAERLRRAGALVPVLLITGSSSPAILARASSLGVEKVLDKPFRDEDLLNFVSAHH